MKLTVQHQASDHTRTKHGNESVDNWYPVLNSFIVLKFEMLILNELFQNIFIQK